MQKYKIEINWSEEDEAYLANIPELKGCSTHGESYSEAIEMAEDAMEGYIEMLVDLGDTVPTPLSMKECSGRVTLRMNPLLHRDLASQAGFENVSLNELIIKKLNFNESDFVRKSDLEDILERLIKKHMPKLEVSQRMYDISESKINSPSWENYLYENSRPPKGSNTYGVVSRRVIINGKEILLKQIQEGTSEVRESYKKSQFNLISEKILQGTIYSKNK
jgi:predicted RNase H-like HicB family nuclease